MIKKKKIKNLFMNRGGAQPPKLRRPRAVRALQGVERSARECRTREHGPCKKVEG